MPDLIDNPVWEPGIYQLEQTDVARGGNGNIANEQAQQLANRTAWLKNAMRGFDSITSLSASKTLTQTDVLQKLIVINGNGTSQIYDLPTGISSGTIVNIMAYNVTKQVTINSQGSNDIILAGALRQKFYLGDGEAVTLIWDGTHWFIYSHDTQILSVGLPVYAYSQKPNTVIANGQLLNRVDYPRLWEYAQTLGASLIDDLTWTGTNGNKGFFSTGNNATTFRIPDLRGQFIRSLDLGASVDFGRLNEAPGGYEQDQFQGHTFGLSDGSKLDSSDKNNGSPSTAIAGVTKTEFKTAVTERAAIVSDGVNGLPRTGSETRPKNIGLIPLINI